MPNTNILSLLSERFGQEAEERCVELESAAASGLASHASCRAFDDRPVDTGLLQTLCALALCSPTKSDLQQRDIIIVDAPDVRDRIDALLEQFAWVSRAPAMLIFCGNNRRQRQLHEKRGHPFVNDHLDAFFNPAVDAAIALSAFVIAAESVGLGCCPLSAIRNDCDTVAELLGLPDHVFPVSGLAVGYPSAEHKAEISMRLPLDMTVHVNRFDERGAATGLEDYDRRRAERQPYAAQRAVETFGATGTYTWSEDKARQYALPERQDFGRHVVRKGFRLD